MSKAKLLTLDSVHRLMLKAKEKSKTSTLNVTKSVVYCIQGSEN
jgi:hypothetical protein